MEPLLIPPRKSPIKTPGGSPTLITQSVSPAGSPIIRYLYLSLGDSDLEVKLVVKVNRYAEVEAAFSTPGGYLGTIRLSLHDDLLEVFADAMELSVGIFTRLVEDILGSEAVSFTPPPIDEDSQALSPYHDSPREEVS